ncbi:hypothetical protein [Bacillus thuringiensis]|uniref:hypothetical protein n=1 Tax=Bacillus thuringiensis TaxID=1428 RepID=UPI002540BA55|nr:hypothetical protein [Bacillus thuringiensis]WIG14989.1 hypothetical protein QOM09_13170 [Bacillus thuringiensis]
MMKEKFIRVREMNSKLWTNFQRATKDFCKSSDVEFDEKVYGEFAYYSDTPYCRERLGVEFPIEYMVFITFVYLKDFDYVFKPMEKVLWEIPFCYKGYECCFTVSKFNYDLLIDTKDEEVARELLKKLNSVVKMSDKICAPLIEETMNQGEITLENKLISIRGRYEYFRRNAEDLFTRPVNEKEFGEEKTLSKFVQIKNMKRNLIFEASFNAQAMLDAYFSWQEHLLVLLLPFSKFNKEEDNLSEFIGTEWTKKINRIFTPSKSPTLSRHYEKLRIIKETYRNKSTHGEFEKNNGSFYIHFGALGALPFQMSKHKNELDFTLVSISDSNFEQILDDLDEFEKFLTTDEFWKNPYKLVTSGIDLSFDDKSIKNYLEAIKSEEGTEGYIQYVLDCEDNHRNMDW